MSPRTAPGNRNVLALAGALCAWVPFAIGVGASSISGSPSARPIPPDWIGWRDQQISRILEPLKTPDGVPYLDRGEVSRKCAEAWQTVRSEADSLRTRPELSNFLSFLQGQNWASLTGPDGRKDHRLGLDVSDRRYYEESRDHLAFPELLRSEAFLQAMADPRRNREAWEMIERHNSSLPERQKWLMLPYRARFVFSVDRTTYGRMLVLIPNEVRGSSVVDTWLNYAIALPDQDPPPQAMSVSMIVIERGTDPGSEARAYFMDFLRVRDPLTGRIRLEPTVNLAPSPSQNCYDCHKSSIIPIFPEAEYRFLPTGRLETVAESRAADFNRRIRGYGKAPMGHQDRGAYGPCIGEPGLTRTDDFIRSAAGDPDLADASIAKIRSAMGCASCHDAFAPLNFVEPVETDRETRSMKLKKGLAQTFVEEGRMPPGNDLNSRERRALWKALSKEYLDLPTGRGTFVDWLRGGRL